MAITIQQGMDQSTPAMKSIISGAMRSNGGTRSASPRKRRSKVKRAISKAAKMVRRASSGVKKLKKGSAAAKAWGKRMAKLRKG